MKPLRLTKHGSTVVVAGFGLAALVGQPLAAQTAGLIDGIVDRGAPVLEVHKSVGLDRPRRHPIAHRHVPYAAIARPTLAGVALMAPIPGPLKQPRPIVPAPAYPLDSLASDLTIPPPAIVCQRGRPVAGPPPSYRKISLFCGYDID